MSNSLLKEDKRKKIGLSSCLLFGLGVLSPLAPLLVYGSIQSLTLGHMALAYIIALIPMTFVAYTYGSFSAEFPRGGSAYTYVSKGLNPHVGFIAGWAILLDYCLVPLMAIMLVGIYVNNIFPSVNPYVVMCVAIVLVMVINLAGIKGLSSVNNIVTIIAFAVIIYFIVAAIGVFTKNTAGITFSSTGFYNPKTFNWGFVAQGAAIACFSFMGFDAITALAEDVKKPAKTLPKAIILTCVLLAVLFVVVCWVGQCLYPDFNAYTNPDAGLMDALAIAGGQTLCTLISLCMAVCMFALTVDMMAASTRLMFAMGREGAIPQKLFGFESKKHVPVINIIILSAVNASFIWVDVNTIISMITFGGLLAYILVTFSGARYFFFKKKENKGKSILTNLIFPLIGCATCVYLWLNLGNDAKILGISWTAFGIVYMAIKSKGFKKPVALESDAVDAMFEQTADKEQASLTVEAADASLEEA